MEERIEKYEAKECLSTGKNFRSHRYRRRKIAANNEADKNKDSVVLENTQGKASKKNKREKEGKSNEETIECEEKQEGEEKKAKTCDELSESTTDIDRESEASEGSLDEWEVSEKRGSEETVTGEVEEERKAGQLSESEYKMLEKAVLELRLRLRPSEQSQKEKMQFVDTIRKILREEFPGTEIQVNVFGSTANGLETVYSDLDICLTTQNVEASCILKLDSILKQRGYLTTCISTARVPLVRVVGNNNSILADFNINNPMALYNTKMVKTFVGIDSRVQPFLMAIKHWAKQRGVSNAGSGGTLSPYAWVNLGIAYLQMQNPPILPVLHRPRDPNGERALQESRVSDLDFESDISKNFGYGRKNKDNLGRLLFGFFKYFAIEFDYDKSVISVRHGKCISKESKIWNIGRPAKIMCIEEPFSIWLNLAHSANYFALSSIRNEFIRAFNILLRRKSFTSIWDPIDGYNFHPDSLPPSQYRLADSPFVPSQQYSRLESLLGAPYHQPHSRIQALASSICTCKVKNPTNVFVHGPQCYLSRAPSVDRFGMMYNYFSYKKPKSTSTTNCSNISLNNLVDSCFYSDSAESEDTFKFGDRNFMSLNNRVL
ncbi:Poly(A) RNA polymerase cid11 [Zancudomyces culisetae]|uniref:polynucleotide adenylyltransferase n=1 Tax=Zancudomyces culisetae TaxID=1213189 RepID=A0A1R1PQN3_ZANCU|nr:Poly(A) RNA polymerase cid11 [Zancudomyces culisetae]|eukprot:OMH83264.1 Poly(A) RNA polymerase cid11 [Zancudomyces culisetae]